MEEPLVLNLGCGYSKEPGMTNVDAFDVCEPDVVWNLNNFPWPWETWTGRTPNGLIFTVCAIGLTVLALTVHRGEPDIRDADSVTST